MINVSVTNIMVVTKYQTQFPPKIYWNNTMSNYLWLWNSSRVFTCLRLHIKTMYIAIFQKRSFSHGQAIQVLTKILYIYTNQKWFK